MGFFGHCILDPEQVFIFTSSSCLLVQLNTAEIVNQFSWESMFSTFIFLFNIGLRSIHRASNKLTIRLIDNKINFYFKDDFHCNQAFKLFEDCHFKFFDSSTVFLNIKNSCLVYPLSSEIINISDFIKSYTLNNCLYINDLFWDNLRQIKTCNEEFFVELSLEIDKKKFHNIKLLANESFILAGSHNNFNN